MSWCQLFQSYILVTGTKNNSSSWLAMLFWITVKPLNSDHIGDGTFCHYSEVSLFVTFDVLLSTITIF